MVHYHSLHVPNHGLVYASTAPTHRQPLFSLILLLFFFSILSLVNKSTVVALIGLRVFFCTTLPQ
jgi:hypothetical protein